MSSAELLHEYAVGQCFSNDEPVIDFLTLCNVELDFELSLVANFQLYLFAGRGHSVSPSRFTVSRMPDNASVSTASFGCGLKDDDGRFLYPRAGRHFGESDAAPETESGWAFYRSETYYRSLRDWKRCR